MPGHAHRWLRGYQRGAGERYQPHPRRHRYSGTVGACQLTAAYTGLNAAMGGSRGMTLHLTWMKAPHAKVVLHPGGNAQAMLTWRVNVGSATPFNPSVTRITPPDEYTYLRTLWQGGPVLGGGIVSWPLRAAPAGPFPAGTGTIANPFIGMCMALAGDGTDGAPVRYRPAPRSAAVASSFTVFTLLAIPGIVLTLALASWRYGVTLSVSPMAFRR